MHAPHALRAILTTCVKHSALAFLLVVQALHPLRAILAACVKHLVAFWPSAYIAFGHAAFGHAAFGHAAFGLTSFGHTAFDRVRHAFGARLYPLTLVWCVTWPPRSPLPTPTQRRGVDLGGAYTVLATEPVLEASTCTLPPLRAPSPRRAAEKSSLHSLRYIPFCLLAVNLFWLQPMWRRILSPAPRPWAR